MDQPGENKTSIARRARRKNTREEGGVPPSSFTVKLRHLLLWRKFFESFSLFSKERSFNPMNILLGQSKPA
jgi:hypothetical protein